MRQDRHTWFNSAPRQHNANECGDVFVCDGSLALDDVHAGVLRDGEGGWLAC